MEGGFDALRAVVVGGPGVVARFPGVVCVVAAGSADAVRTLLDLCTKAAGTAPGRPLGRSLARWLAGPDAPPDDLVFGTVAAADDRVAVFLSGDIGVRVAATGATFSGADSAAWTDRLITHDGSPLVLAAAGTAVPGDVGEHLHDLRAGVVPGGAVALLPPGAGLPTGAHAVPEVAEPAPAAEVRPPPEPRRPRRSARIDGHVAAAAPRAPLDEGDPAGGPLRRVGRRAGASPEPAAEGAGREALTEQSRDPLAHGYVCSRGHLNDPRSHFCVLCGIRMNERTGVLTTGPRPPLGLLVFDDGRTYTVDAEYVVGRLPEADGRVRSGELRALMVEDRAGTVSRVHAEIRVSEWDVLLVDTGSRNGTFVVPPAAAAWERVPERQTYRLEPGTRVRLGHHRTFVFESPSGVR
ncbi:MAG: hypothetical protein QOK35_2979 [Pseudonocardiales bacterium]|nr:hypothetical protein [Pseudonocardiales bacterium]